MRDRSTKQATEPRSRRARLLITTFDTWLPHQPSNAADDLVQDAINRCGVPEDVRLLRHLPVENAAASQAVYEAIAQVEPTIVLCCGMAESRSRLNLERQAQLAGQIRQTAIDLDAWCRRLRCTDISHDAGSFVCNYLYYQVLGVCIHQSIETAAIVPSTPPRHGLFLHVPRLTADNRQDCIDDFVTLVDICLKRS